MTSVCGASSHFVDSNLVGHIASRLKNIVKLHPLATIVVAGHSTLRGVSIGTFAVRVTNAQDFLHDMLLPAMNMPVLGGHLFSGGTAALKEINTIIAKESYLDVGQFKITLRKDMERHIRLPRLELAQRGNYQMKQAFSTRVISGHTIPTGSVLASQRLKSGTMETAAPLTTVARPFIATYTEAPGPPALQTTASAHCARLISGDTMGATTSFTVPTITSGLVTATTTATPAMPTTAMEAAGS